MMYKIENLIYKLVEESSQATLSNILSRKTNYTTSHVI